MAVKILDFSRWIIYFRQPGQPHQSNRQVLAIYGVKVIEETWRVNNLIVV